MTKAQWKPDVLQFLKKYFWAFVQYGGDLKADGIGANINCSELQTCAIRICKLKSKIDILRL